VANGEIPCVAIGYGTLSNSSTCPHPTMWVWAREKNCSMEELTYTKQRWTTCWRRRHRYPPFILYSTWIPWTRLPLSYHNPFLHLFLFSSLLYICQLIYNPEYYAKVNCNSYKEEGRGVKMGATLWWGGGGTEGRGKACESPEQLKILHGKFQLRISTYIIPTLQFNIEGCAPVKSPENWVELEETRFN